MNFGAIPLAVILDWGKRLARVVDVLAAGVAPIGPNVAQHVAPVVVRLEQQGVSNDDQKRLGSRHGNVESLQKKQKILS